MSSGWLRRFPVISACRHRHRSLATRAVATLPVPSLLTTSSPNLQGPCLTPRVRVKGKEVGGGRGGLEGGGCGGGCGNAAGRGVKGLFS